MRLHILTFLFALTFTALQAQNVGKIDSLKQSLSQSAQDTNRVKLYYELGNHYVYSYPDTTLSYALPGLALARKLNFKKGEIRGLLITGEALAIKGNYTKSLKLKLEALEEAEKLNDPRVIAGCQISLGTNYYYSKDYAKALFYYKKAIEDNQFIKRPGKAVSGLLGRVYFDLNNIHSAYFYIHQCYQLDIKDQNHWTVPYYYMAAICEKKRNYQEALNYYRAGNQVAVSGALDMFNGYTGMASVFYKIAKEDSAIYYAKKVVVDGFKRSYFTAVLDASNLLTLIYKSRHIADSAFKYQEVMLSVKDSLFSQEKVMFIQNLSSNEQQRQQEIVVQQEQYRNKIRLNALLAVGIVLLGVTMILWRNNQHKQRAFALLQKQKDETERQKAKTEQAYEELKATQTQLIQREKMASLGELTAGIAHEIQNPLNFVNNFSDINTELIEELEQEADRGNIDEVKSIANDIKENEQKINHHGKRADAIVKGMLQHSRASTGKKELTDINALADEYLRLSYHGIRAKDKDFNVEIKTEFDESIGKIEVVPQDIGRVLLNLYNNAFYAASLPPIAIGAIGTEGGFKDPLLKHQPTVWITTSKIPPSGGGGAMVSISVRDNGSGIPPNIVDKIFQPFFTTKPTGQGTGLGLSLSYDIIKAHGGELKVKTKEGEGAEFVIELPM